jgi:salicylate hydroxylase
MALNKTLVSSSGAHMDEDLFRESWGTELILFAHDATDKVKDWWGQWGYMIAKGHKLPAPAIQVSISMGNTVVSRPG